MSLIMNLPRTVHTYRICYTKLLSQNAISLATFFMCSGLTIDMTISGWCGCAEIGFTSTKQPIEVGTMMDLWWTFSLQIFYLIFVRGFFCIATISHGAHMLHRTRWASRKCKKPCIVAEMNVALASAVALTLSGNFTNVSLVHKKIFELNAVSWILP